MRHRFARSFAVLGGLLAGCGGGGPGKIMADTPALPYQAPDIDEITGIDSDAEPSEPAPPPEPVAAPTPAPAPAPAPVAPPPAAKPAPKAPPKAPAKKP